MGFPLVEFVFRDCHALFMLGFEFLSRSRCSCLQRFDLGLGLALHGLASGPGLIGFLFQLCV